MSTSTIDKDMEKSVAELFERYRNFFCAALAGNADLAQVASSYASSFIAASPAGVMMGANDAAFLETMRNGFEYYRPTGTKDMSIRHIRISPIDELHCIAHVSWTAIYTRKDGTDVSIDFNVHYFIQKLGGEPKIFGWVTGDEQAALKQHGVI